MKTLVTLCVALTLLSGCDRLSERLGIPDPAKVKAEGKAVGGACRHAGRGLEDCYKLNPGADIASVYEGWKEMNEYMAKNGMQAVPPALSDAPAKGEKAPEHGAATDAEHGKPAEKADGKSDGKPEGKSAKDDHPPAAH